MTIEELMAKSPAACRADDTLRKAAQATSGSNCKGVPVKAGNRYQRLVAMITDHHTHMAPLFDGRTGEKALNNLRVKDVMLKELRACRPRDSSVEVEAIMQVALGRRPPVVDGAKHLICALSPAELVGEAGHGARVEQAGNEGFGEHHDVEIVMVNPKITTEHPEDRRGAPAAPRDPRRLRVNPGGTPVRCTNS